MTVMRELHLDYQRAYKPVPWMGVAVLVLAVAALSLLGGYYRTLDQQIVAWERKLERIQRLSSHVALVSRPVTAQATRARSLEVTQANQVVRQLSLPWNALFKAVEPSRAGKIALLSLEPDPANGAVTISGEAKDFSALLAYTKQLSTSGIFDSVMLKSHRIQEDDPEKPLRFSLLARWKGVAP